MGLVILHPLAEFVIQTRGRDGGSLEKFHRRKRHSILAQAGIHVPPYIFAGGISPYKLMVSHSHSCVPPPPAAIGCG